MIASWRRIGNDGVDVRLTVRRRISAPSATLQLAVMSERGLSF
jgi:hypothetical protein